MNSMARRELIRDGAQVVLTHGNGPQVGNLLIQNEAAGRHASGAARRVRRGNATICRLEEALAG